VIVSPDELEGDFGALPNSYAKGCPCGKCASLRLHRSVAVLAILGDVARLFAWAAEGRAFLRGYERRGV